MKIMYVFAGNLATDITEDELRREFTPYGEVLSITIMNDRYIGSGQPNEYAYIEMISKEGVENAVANLDGKKIKDRAIRVVAALPTAKNGIKTPDGTGKRYNSKRHREPQIIAPHPGRSN